MNRFHEALVDLLRTMTWVPAAVVGLSIFAALAAALLPTLLGVPVDTALAISYSLMGLAVLAAALLALRYWLVHDDEEAEDSMPSRAGEDSRGRKP